MMARWGGPCRWWWCAGQAVMGKSGAVAGNTVGWMCGGRKDEEVKRMLRRGGEGNVVLWVMSKYIRSSLCVCNNRCSVFMRVTEPWRTKTSQRASFLVLSSSSEWRFVDITLKD